MTKKEEEEEGRELLSFKSFWRKGRRIDQEGRKIEGDRKKRNEAETEERDRKEGIPSTKFPEGGNAVYTDRPMASPMGDFFKI